jgi:hypothetical protein
VIFVKRRRPSKLIIRIVFFTAKRSQKYDRKKEDAFPRSAKNEVKQKLVRRDNALSRTKADDFKMAKMTLQ